MTRMTVALNRESGWAARSEVAGVRGEAAGVGTRRLDSGGSGALSAETDLTPRLFDHDHHDPDVKSAPRYRGHPPQTGSDAEVVAAVTAGRTGAPPAGPRPAGPPCVTELHTAQVPRARNLSPVQLGNKRHAHGGAAGPPCTREALKGLELGFWGFGGAAETGLCGVRAVPRGPDRERSTVPGRGGRPRETPATSAPGSNVRRRTALN